MKKILKRSLAMTVVICLLLSFAITSFAAAPSTYSKTKNSGTRDEVCTTLDGTSASAYYTGQYTYDNLSSQSSAQLLNSLRKLMTDTHKHETSYDNCRDYADETDCENGSGNIITLYTSYSSSQSQYNSGSGWNREHVWPQSLGGFKKSGPGSDLHHIRPTENRTNSNRGNQLYGNVSGGKTSTGNLSSLVGGTYDGTYFEPLDNVKGDVARICLYVYVRWGGDSSYACGNLNKVFKDVDTLLEWCELDPVDTWEMGRNEVVYGIQGNRNVFIDYPELAWIMLGEDVPEGMQTPSGITDSGDIGGGDDNGNTEGGNTEGGNTEGGNNDNTGSGNNNGNSGSTTPHACAHTSTTIIFQMDATCVENGYTGDEICSNCRKVLSVGVVIYAEGHSYGEETITKEATEDEDGESVKICEKCGDEVKTSIAAIVVEEEDLGFFARLIAMIKEFFAGLFGGKD